MAETARPTDAAPRRGPTRRTLLKTVAGSALPALAAAGAAVPAAAGCSRQDRQLEVFVVWSGAELNAFRAVLAGFTRDGGTRVKVVSAGEQLNELLRARMDAGNPPDVAILPQIGLIGDYVRKDWLTALDPGLGGNFAPGWRELVSVDGRLFGVWIKAAHKSLVWHSSSALANRPTPRTWADFVALVRALAVSGPAPLAVGAADGWVLTDWFENVLIGLGGAATYQALARGQGDWTSPQVRQALTMLAEVWAVQRAFPYGPAVALRTQFGESVAEVFATRRAAMVFEGDFVAAVVAGLRENRSVEPPAWFRFPGVDAATRPLVVAGDAAVVLRDSSPGRELVSWLVRPEVFRPWIGRGGFLSPNTRIPLTEYPDATSRQLARHLREEQVYFDLSDQAVGGLASGQGRGMWWIFQDFFAAVTRPGADTGAAVRRTLGRLGKAAQQD